jgi:hypothetical protein
MRRDTATKLATALGAICNHFIAIEHGKADKFIYETESAISDAKVALLKDELGFTDPPSAESEPDTLTRCESCGRKCTTIQRTAVLSGIGFGLSVCKQCLPVLESISWKKYTL